MASRDWFRKTTWTANDREDFFLRLNRSYEDRRAQYLRIQAVRLRDTGTSENARAAIELTNLLIERYPTPIEMSGAYLVKAECLNRIGELAGAEEAFHASLNAMRTKPSVLTGAELVFGLFVIEHSIIRLYEEALSALDEFEPRFLFPLDLYRYFGIRAIILARLGHKELAGPLAAKAIEASRQTHSGLARHANLGLVTEPDPTIHDELVRILTQ